MDQYGWRVFCHMNESTAQSRPSGETGCGFGWSNPITPAGMSMVKMEPL